MLIRNTSAYLEGRFVPGTDVRVAEGIVQEVGTALAACDGETIIDGAGQYLLPGFVDVHIHGYAGHDTMEGEEAVRRMSRGLYSQGVAAFLPTTMSASCADTQAAVAGIRAVMERPEAAGARVLGAHMEAPFLAPSKCGAQVKEHFINPSMEALLRYTNDDVAAVRIVTMAPELEGSEAFIREAGAAGITVSIGHTAATGEITHLAADWGATHVTHTFNAQTPIHHRDPGVPGAALVDDRLYCEMICDGVHLHPDIIRLLARAKGTQRAVMVTDSMEAAGLPDGEYALGGQAVFVRDGEARLASGVLAGSVLTMPQALRNMIHRFGFAPEDAVGMCTATPADSINEKVAGRIVPGSPAPLTLWDKEWNTMQVIGG